jgi:hypothetical protein
MAAAVHDMAISTALVKQQPSGARHPGVMVLRCWRCGAPWLVVAEVAVVLLLCLLSLSDQ